MDESLTRTRPLRFQFGGQAGGYSQAEDWENNERQLNAQSQPVAIQAWLRGYNLLLSALFSDTPQLRYSSGETGDNGAHRSYWLSYSLICLSGRAMKPALDLILGSYYTEALALERAMLEGWVRSVYVRLRKQRDPEVWRRWFEPYEEEFTGSPPLREPGWGLAADYIRSHGNDEDRQLIEEAQLRWNFLNRGSHPSGYGIDQMRNDSLNLMKFQPEHDDDYCVQALNHGVFIQTLLLREVQSLKQFPEGWVADLDNFMTLAGQLSDLVKPGLETYAKALRAERNAKGKHSACEAEP